MFCHSESAVLWRDEESLTLDPSLRSG